MKRSSCNDPARTLRGAPVGRAIRSALLGSLVAGSALTPRAAQAEIPVGAEFQVNTYTTAYQGYPSVAAAGDGSFVVVWNSVGSPGTDASGVAVQGQRYASDGTPLGSQFQVNSYTTSQQADASVAVEGDGDFTVVWSSVGSSGSDTSYVSIQGQRFASNGTAQGGEFQVNTYTESYQFGASAAAAGDGRFVVVWQSYGSSAGDSSYFSVQGQRYASSGALLGGQFQVNSYTEGYQGYASVAMETDGDFVVVWQSDGSSGTDSDVASIQGQRYASSGAPLGGQFQVNSYTTSEQYYPSVAVDGDGDFAVVWQSLGSSGTDLSGFGIQGQRYASNGSALGGEFQVNTYTTSDQEYPSVAVDGDGDFAVVWQSLGSSGTDASLQSIQGRRFASDGTPVGGEFQVNSYATGYQRYPSVAAEPDGDFAVVWESSGSSGTDASGESVQGQRYRAENADADADSVANGVDNCLDAANPAQVDADGDGCGNACDSDFDQNGVSGSSDFNTVRFCFGEDVPGAGPAEDPTCAETDMDGNGVVGAPDFNSFRTRFADPPGPGSPGCL